MQVLDVLGHDYIKPGFWGAVAGAIAMAVIGFWGMGWSTAANADRLAKEQSEAAVVTALVPYCVANAQHDPDRAKLTKFRAEDESYKRSQIVQDSGWATMLGATTSDYTLANACSAKLADTKAG
jgi:hypothetical protein